MYKVITGLLFIATIGGACKKEMSRHVDPETLSSIDIVCDGEDINKSYASDQHNIFSAYSFGGVAGTYFGYISSFDINDKCNLEIRLGTLLSQYTQLTDSQALQLTAPGSRVFGSLGSFNSFPDIKPGCAEIAFTDKDANRWSSTAMTEQQTPYGIQAAISVNQPVESEFVIEKVRPVNISNGHLALHITGHFKCLVYAVNGNASKKMSGNFAGIVSSGD